MPRPSVLMLSGSFSFAIAHGYRKSGEDGLARKRRYRLPFPAFSGLGNGAPADLDPGVP